MNFEQLPKQEEKKVYPENLTESEKAERDRTLKECETGNSEEQLQALVEEREHWIFEIGHEATDAKAGDGRLDFIHSLLEEIVEKYGDKKEE